MPWLPILQLLLLVGWYTVFPAMSALIVFIPLMIVTVMIGLCVGAFVLVWYGQR